MIMADLIYRKVEIGSMVWNLNVDFSFSAGASEEHGSEGFSAPRPASSAQSDVYPAGNQLNTAMTRLIQESSMIGLWPACWSSSEHSLDHIGTRILRSEGVSNLLGLS